MKYNISKSSSPTKLVLDKGTDSLKLPLFQASKDINQPLVPMLPPIFDLDELKQQFSGRDIPGRQHLAPMQNNGSAYISAG